MLTLLEEQGVKVGHARQTISARLADTDIAGLLEVPVGAAALTRFQEAGVITPEQTTVLILTGTGLKSAERMAALY